MPDVEPRYGVTARVLHWVIAALVVVQITAGIAMTSAPLEAVTAPVYIYHKGMGAFLLLLVVARIAWRVAHRPPPFPAFMSEREQRMANAGHIGMYALLLLMTVSGYVLTVGDSYPIELLDALGVPPLIPPMPRVAAVMLVVHHFTVFGLVVMVAGHVAMVVRHQLIDRNPEMRRMWPPWGR
jgi:cytochrome b561